MPRIRQWLSRNATIGDGMHYNTGDTPFAQHIGTDITDGGIRGPRLQFNAIGDQVEWNLPDDNYISGVIYLWLTDIPTSQSLSTVFCAVGDINDPSFLLCITHTRRLRIMGNGPSGYTSPVFQQNKRLRVEWQTGGGDTEARVYSGDSKVHLAKTHAQSKQNAPGKIAVGLLSNPGNNTNILVEGLVVYDTKVWIGPQFLSTVPIKRWNGNTFKEGGTMRRWSGSSMKEGGTLRRWTGSGWDPAP